MAAVAVLETMVVCSVAAAMVVIMIHCFSDALLALVHSSHGDCNGLLQLWLVAVVVELWLWCLVAMWL